MNYKTFTLLTLLLVSSSTYILAQRKIIIKDIDTFEPLTNAQIMFSLTKDMTNPKGATTNTKGEANIAYPSACYFKVFNIGYANKTGVIGQNGNDITVMLKPTEYEFDQIVVTGSRTPRPIKNSPVVTQVISAKKLTESGFDGIQNALMQEIPGLNFQKVGFGTDINVSGLDARHILFLIDGERLTGEMAGNLDYQRFNLHGIDRIEIVKGASSTLYGSRAAGAVINLITKKTTKTLTVDAGMRYGEMNQENYKNPRKSDFLYMYEKNVDFPNLQSWLSLGSKLGDFTIQSDVMYSSTDAFYLFQSDYDVKEFPADHSIGLMRDTSITSWLKRPPLGIEGTQHINISQKLYYEPSENFSAQLYGSMFYLNTFDMVQDLQFAQAKDHTGGAKINYKFNNYAEATLSFHTDFYKRYKRQERVDTRSIVYDSQIYQPRLIVVSNYFDKHNIMFGGDYFKDLLTSDRFKNNDLTKRDKIDIEYFVQDEYMINSKYTIVAGFRSSYNENYGTNVAPKFALKYSPSEKVSVRFNYAAGYRTPSIKELYFNWDHLGMFQIIGDEYLQPENNNYYSLSTQYATPDIFLSGNIYANYFRDKIEGVWRIYDFQYNFEYRNLSKSRIMGTEIIGRLKLSEPLMFNLSYSYVNVDKIDGVQLNSTSPHTGSLGLKYKYQKKDYYLTANISTSITGKKQFSVQDKMVINGTSHNAYFDVEIPTYTMCNLSITQKFYNSIKLTVGIDNFLNYKPKTLGAGITMFNVAATPGRRYFIQMNFTLENLKNIFK